MRGVISGMFLVPLLIAVLLQSSQLVESARILGVFPAPSISHQVIYRALMMELARRGHQLVVVTTDPLNDPTISNYTEIDISLLYKPINERRKDLPLGTFPPTIGIAFAMEMYNQLSELMFESKDLRDLISQDNVNEHFDLVFVEWFLNPCVAAFSHRFNAPMIGILSAPPFSILHDTFGNPTNPSYIADIFLPYVSQNRTFFQRLDAFKLHIFSHIYFYSRFLPKQDAIAKSYFGPNTPYIGDLLSQVSAVFMNIIEGFHLPRPNVPSVVYINGFNIKPSKPLPKDIQQFLDSSPKGAIYMSLGSNVKSVNLPVEKRQAFLEAFSELRDYHVLWKWEADNLPGQPANVKTVKWAPQQDVLRHPNIKVFITQGGLQSAEEAIHAKVPMVAIPFFGDQIHNAHLGQERGVTVPLSINELTKDTVLSALRKILNDNSYAENMRRLSAIVSDQPSKPMERAVWWTEYVLRHKGAAHLRTAAVDMPWYRYLLLDVVLFLVATTMLASLLFWRAAKFLYKKLLRSPRKMKTS